MKDPKGVLDIPCKLGTLNHHVKDGFVDAADPARAEDAIRRQPDWDFVNDAMNVGANACPLVI